MYYDRYQSSDGNIYVDSKEEKRLDITVNNDLLMGILKLIVKKKRE